MGKKNIIRVELNCRMGGLRRSPEDTMSSRGPRSVLDQDIHVVHRMTACPCSDREEDDFKV